METRVLVLIGVVSLAGVFLYSRTDSAAAAPPGMVWIPGGEFMMGAKPDPLGNDVCMRATYDSRPIHRVSVDGFYMDKTDVSNDEFARFVEATGYITLAERTPRAEDFPGAPPGNLVAGGVVFTPPSGPVPLDNHLRWWSYVAGANWRHPIGPASDIRGKGKYPVVQVAYDDAVAYAKWADKRLPTEAEWEFAARGGLSGKVYAWGDVFRPAGRWMANTHQGQFPIEDTGADGYVGIAPMAQYPPNDYGLYDMAGNVWQWTSDSVSPRLLPTTRHRRRSGSKSTGAGHLIRPGLSQPSRKKSSGADRSCAQISIAPASPSARGARARSAPARIISVSAALNRAGRRSSGAWRVTST